MKDLWHYTNHPEDAISLPPDDWRVQAVTLLERIANALEEIAYDEQGLVRTVSRPTEHSFDPPTFTMEGAEVVGGAIVGRDSAVEVLPPFPLARIQERSGDVQVMVSEPVEMVEVVHGAPMIATMAPGRWYSWPKDAALKVAGFAPLDIAAELRKQRGEAP